MKGVLFTSPVPSPCTSICAIDQVTGWCAGCMRTIDEIVAWSVYTDDDKRAVWAALARRRAKLAGAPLGEGNLQQRDRRNGTDDDR